ncbi:MAG TPA: tetratricopeptide repeat protein [Planktothrix sp.]
MAQNCHRKILQLSILTPVALATTLFVGFFFCPEAKGSDTTETDKNHAADSIEKNPPPQLTLQERMYSFAGEHAIKSEADLNKQIALHPNSPTLLLQLGQADYLDGDADNAFTCYRKALAADPKCAQAHIGLSRVYFAIGKDKQGYEELQKAVKDGNQDIASSALWESAFVHMRHGEYEPALADFDKAFKKGLIGKVKNATALLERSEIYSVQGKQELALADLNQAYKLEPNEVLVRKDRAVVLGQLHRYKEALAECNAALEISRKYSTISVGPMLTLRGDIYRSLGRNDLAVLDYRAAKNAQADDFTLVPFRSRK